jgi:signal transduction histidine kinase/CheY-like chemotaxis protein
LRPTSSALLAALQRRPKSLVLGFTAAILIAVGAVQAADLWWRREQMVDTAGARAVNLSRVVAEYVRDSFAVTDTSLRQLAIHGRRVGGPSAPAQAWDPILAAAKVSLAGSGSITVTDATGRIVHSTQRAIVGQSRRDNYIFKQLSASDRDTLVVDRPFLTVLEPKRYVIPLGRRLTSDTGAFDGMVVATVIPDTYREFFRTVNVGDHGIIWVFHPDGVVLFREPSSANPINQPAAANPVLQAALHTSAGGLVDAPFDANGPRFVSGYRTLETPPLIVAVSLNLNDVLADWRHQREITSLAFIVLTVTFSGIVLVLFRQVNARIQVERALSEVQQLESTRLREANEKLAETLEREQRARREVEAASYLKDEFLMTISHELRTPLTAIYGWVRLLSGERMTPEQQARALAAVERNARAQTRLIDDLLDVSRAISGKLQIDARPANLADVLLAAVETLGPALEAKRIQFQSQLDPELTIPVDADRLQQVVWNLLSNAIKFTPEGGTVELRLCRNGSQVEIAVIDSGTGIEPDFLPYVFERFRQGDAGSRRRYGGMGLGLAIVRHLVELHGGTVRAESDGYGKGSTFRIFLPARDVRRAMAEEQPAASKDLAIAPPARLDGTRILIVDDDPDARELFSSILGRAGALVSAVSSVSEAMRSLADEMVDVIVSDIEMPIEDGYQLLERIVSAYGSNGGRPIAIAVTAYARNVDKRRALDAGFHCHFAKPVEPSALVATISSLVNGKSDPLSSLAASPARAGSASADASADQP